MRVGLVGRDEVGDVPDEEHLARDGVEDARGVDAAVAARDDGIARVLRPTGQALEARAVGFEIIGAKAFEALDESFHGSKPSMAGRVEAGTHAERLCAQ